MSETHRITVDPAQCGGRPCLRGLRIRVNDVLDLLADGANRKKSLPSFRCWKPGTSPLHLNMRLQSDHPVLHVA